MLAAAFWLAATAGQGFQFSNDSISYAALALGFDGGHPFTSSILWLNAQPGRLQAIWPPLFPALIALVHALGPAVTWSEWLVVGAAYVASAVFGVLAVREVAGHCPWGGVVLCAGWPAGLAVARFGWSEPVLLALLGLHYWLAARAVTGRGGPRTLFLQGFAAGWGFLARYGAAPFVATAAVLGPVLQSRRRRGGAVPGTRWTWLAGAAGGALPIVPWAAAALAITGRVGPPYVAAGGGLRPTLAAAARAVLQAVGSMAPSSVFSGPHADKYGALAIAGVTLAVTLVALRLDRGRKEVAGPGGRSAAILCGLLVMDAAAYAAFILALRATYYFDSIDLRLIIPALYPLLLAAVAAATIVPARLGSRAWLLPVCALSVWSGLRTAGEALRRPVLTASMHPQLCTTGTAGDCGLFSWLEEHGGPATLVVTNVAYPLNFATRQGVEALTVYPYQPRVTATMVAGWAGAWERAHPGGEVLLALDATAGPVAAPAAAYGPYPASAWAGAASDPSAGIAATPIVTQPGYRVFELHVDAP